MTQTAVPMPDLKGRNALVLCGEQGLGLQAAWSLGQAGARLMLAGDSAEQLETAVQDLQDEGVDARWVQVRGTQPPELQRVVAQTLERMGDIHVLVSENRLHLALPDWRHSLEMSLNVGFDLGQCVVTSSMADVRQGCIIYLLECHAQPTLRAEGSLDQALRLTEQAVKKWATLWRDHGVRVNAACVCQNIQTKSTKEFIQAAVWRLANHTDAPINGQCLMLND